MHSHVNENSRNPGIRPNLTPNENKMISVPSEEQTIQYFNMDTQGQAKAIFEESAVEQLS
jgi:hypothetical protein